LRIAVGFKSHNDGAAIGVESDHVRRVDRRGAGGDQAPMTVLAGLDFPKLFVIVIGELRGDISGFVHQPIGVGFPRFIDQAHVAIWIGK
jgi:hypothetical protein